jgi:hypothetical protein
MGCKKFLLLCLFVFLARLLWSGEESYDKLSSPDAAVRKQAHDAILERHKNLIAYVIQVAAENEQVSGFWSGKYYAVRLLGEIRSVEAVPILIKSLDYLPKGVNYDTQLKREAYYIAAVALVSIGDAACDPALGVLAEDKIALRRELATWVLMQVKGKEKALRWLEYQLISEGSEVAKTNLKSAIEYIKGFRQAYGPPGFEKLIEKLGN